MLVGESVFHRCIIPRHTTDNCCIDKPINAYLNQHVSERNAWLAFCGLFRILVTDKSGKMTFMVIFSATTLKKLSFLV